MTDWGSSMDRRRFLSWLGSGTAAGLLASAVPQAVLGQATSRPRTRKPNFIIIFTDDQGYQDLGCFGSPDIKTPHIDRMAAEGMRFTDFYVASPVCTPSRAALMTGCYPKRVGLHEGVLFPQDKTGLHPDEITLADLLKSAGYATACVGKWHLGHHKPFLPTRRGFDSYFGIPYSNGMKPDLPDAKWRQVPLMRDEEIIEYPVDQSTLTERYTAEAVKFITANRDKPFFLYLPHTMPHLPLAVSKRFKGKSKGGFYGDVIECIDWSTGQILETLRKLGLEQDTIIAYTSDNGPWLARAVEDARIVGNALPLRDGKGTTYEGGMREPCVMWAPGRIPAGKVCSEMALSMDLYPTFAKLAGAKVPTDRVIDGKDIWPLMSGEADAKTPHEAFFYYDDDASLQAVRCGQWKLRMIPGFGEAAASQAANTQPGTTHPASTLELYDLHADIGETSNLAGKRPEIVTRLRKRMQQFDLELTATARPVGRL